MICQEMEAQVFLGNLKIEHYAQNLLFSHQLLGLQCSGMTLYVPRKKCKGDGGPAGCGGCDGEWGGWGCKGVKGYKNLTTLLASFKLQ